ncbi:MAG: 3-methyl-2-oxobutanoate hydroxymethyltransferase [Desulfurococcales archaeon]|nr:3-methyl-2-oxobutanoate hydroxymethyltransferase [Desulfurococcales archaeon]
MEGKVTVRRILKMKGREKIVMITAYDEPSARLADEAGVDSILVGDSLGMVVLGYENTLKVTMEDMLRHTAAVARARPRALVVADMPFGSYETSQARAVENAVELARVGAEAVKLEGGSEYSDVIRAIVRAGVPVVGHVGLTPQRFLRLGGYRMVGKREDEARLILEDAMAVEEAGAFALVVEYTSPEVARRITEKLSIPTICIGSGPYCDGQVLVLHDVIGLARFSPPFAKRYANVAEVIRRAIEEYAREVREGVFP